MADASAALGAFYVRAVRLPESVQARLREHRDASRERLTRALEEQQRPAPLRFLIQGSYAMNTIIQHPKGDYDIDDGVVLAPGALVGPRGGKLSSVDVKKLVRAAVSTPQLAIQPEVRKNCVRIHYNQGHHVDVPMYREAVTDGRTCLDLASSTWRRADPEGVSRWFDDAVVAKSPDDTNGRQLRRVVRLLKAFARSRPSWSLPSGFIFSILAVECFSPWPGRDDVALYETLRSLHERLGRDLTVRHPVLGEFVTKSNRDDPLEALRDRSLEALKALQILFEHPPSERIYSAWGEFFRRRDFPCTT
jgi:hypothetical protein